MPMSTLIVLHAFPSDLNFFAEVASLALNLYTLHEVLGEDLAVEDTIVGGDGEVNNELAFCR